MNNTCFVRFRKLSSIIAAAMAALMLSYMTLGTVYASSSHESSTLPMISGDIALDMDPEGGYDGEYVLIYNRSLNSRNVQSTGVLSNIDTTQSLLRSAAGGSEDPRLDYHPEALTLSSSFDFSQLGSSGADYQEGDQKTFQVERPLNGSSKPVDFYVVYSGIHCTVWAPVTSQTQRAYTQEAEPEDWDDPQDPDLIAPDGEEEEVQEDGSDGEGFIDMDKFQENDPYEDNSHMSEFIDMDNVKEVSDQNGRSADRSFSFVQRSESWTDGESEGEDTPALYQASLRAYGDERDYLISKEMAISAGEEFDSFYNEMTNNFGMPVDADGSGKISLLFYDIQDGNNPSGYIGGYFSSADLYSSGNSTSMLHIDTYPSIYSPYSSSGKISKSYPTMVHEFQHLLNYSRYYQNQQNGAAGAKPMETWLNEAMSMAAEEMIFPESSIPMRKNTYQQDYYRSIRNGKSLLAFDNSLESYALSSLFSAYLMNQTGGYGVFSQIMDHYVGSEKDAIEAAVSGSFLDGMTFEDILASYRIALAVNDRKGLYGFREDSQLDSLRPLPYTQSGSSISLPGGGSVLIKTSDGHFTPGAGAGSDICFVGISKIQDGVTITKKPAGKAMLQNDSFELEATAMVGGSARTDINWASSDPGVASVIGNGETCQIQALTEGSTRITAECDGYEDYFTLTVSLPPDPSDYAGLVINGTDIHITADEGMYSLIRLVNETPPPGIAEGLDGYNIFLDTSVELENWIPIGTSAGGKHFKGTFKGNGYKIILKSMASDAYDYAGVFGVNQGTIENISVDLRCRLAGSHVGAVAGTNIGTITDPVLTIDAGASIQGRTGRTDSETGGIAGANRGLIQNAYVTNYGTIGSPSCARAGGIAGNSMGNTGTTATIDGATVYNHGVVLSRDDTGGIVGLFQGWNGCHTKMTGSINLIVSKNGEVTSTDSGSVSVGGAIGYAAEFAPGKCEVRNAAITVRMDGKVRSRTGAGSSGGVIGESAPGVFDASNTLVVTLGPEAAVGQASSGFGLICGSNITPILDKWIYAVPYDTAATPLPSGSSYNNQIKRIEYPKEGNPDPVIEIDKDVPTNISSQITPRDGIFIPKTGIADLTGLSAEDANLFNVNTSEQWVLSKASTAPNYFDFHLSADHLNITVPAYLALTNDQALDMTLDISGAENTKQLAEDNPVIGRQTVTVNCVNGRVPDEDWTLKQLQGDAFVDYKPNQYISTNTPSVKEFTLNEAGLYEISATGTSIHDGSQQTVTKYVRLGAPGIVVDGAHLTDAETESWTNLSDTASIVQRLPGGLLRGETVTVKAIDAVIEKNEFKKEAVTFDADLTGEVMNPGNQPVEREFVLYETGRYKITGKAVGISGEVVRYINIDVDAPLPPSLKNVTGSAISANTEYEVLLPAENMVQSPIHAEYSIDGSPFVPLTALTIQLTPQNSTLDLKTIDAATNESQIARYSLSQGSSSSSHSGRSRGTKTIQEGLPYYFPNNNSKSGSAPKIFIGIADKLNGVMNYIAPPGKTVYFTDNPKNFKDIQGHWAKSEIDFVTEREIFVGTDPQIFSPNDNMTRGMFAAVIGRMYERSYGDIPANLTCPFQDVPENYYYKDYISWASEHKIIAGISKDEFEPERSITREEMGAIMYRFARFLDLTKNTSQTELHFADSHKISGWAVQSSKYCQETGLIVGREQNRFEPDKTAQRSEVCAVIHRFVDELLRN